MGAIATEPLIAANDNHHDFYVYAWLRPDGAPFYIGKGRGNRDELPKTHNKFFMNVLEKMSRNGDTPSVVRLHDGLTEAEAFLLERDEIAMHGRRSNGTGVLTNLTDGGEGSTGYYHTEAALAKISSTHKGKIVSPETRAKLSLSSTGRKAFLGRSHTEETREKLSKLRFGTSASEATKKSMSDAQKARYSDPVEREKQRQKQIARWCDPQKRAEHILAMSRDGVRQKISAAATRRSSDPAWQETMRLTNSTPAARAKNAAARISAAPRRGRKYKGITASGNRWRAKIVVCGVPIQLGTYDTQEEAARAYDAKAKTISDKAWLNFPAE